MISLFYILFIIRSYRVFIYNIKRCFFENEKWNLAYFKQKIYLWCSNKYQIHKHRRFLKPFLECFVCKNIPEKENNEKEQIYYGNRKGP